MGQRPRQIRSRPPRTGGQRHLLPQRQPHGDHLVDRKLRHRHAKRELRRGPRRQPRPEPGLPRPSAPEVEPRLAHATLFPPELRLQHGPHDAKLALGLVRHRSLRALRGECRRRRAGARSQNPLCRRHGARGRRFPQERQHALRPFAHHHPQGGRRTQPHAPHRGAQRPQHRLRSARRLHHHRSRRLFACRPLQARAGRRRRTATGRGRHPPVLRPPLDAVELSRGPLLRATARGQAPARNPLRLRTQIHVGRPHPLQPPEPRRLQHAERLPECAHRLGHDLATLRAGLVEHPLVARSRPTAQPPQRRRRASGRARRPKLAARHLSLRQPPREPRPALQRGRRAPLGRRAVLARTHPPAIRARRHRPHRHRAQCAQLRPQRATALCVLENRQPRFQLPRTLLATLHDAAHRRGRQCQPPPHLGGQPRVAPRVEPRDAPLL